MQRHLNRVLFGFLCFIVWSGCTFFPGSCTGESLSVNDERLKPFLSALDDVDRSSLGFTPIQNDARVEIERKTGDAEYDVLLHIYADTSRTIAFKKVGESYEWVGEQEIHTGPRQYLSADGWLNEQIVITYETVYVSGAPQNTVVVLYSGDDQRLSDKIFLNLNDVVPILDEWESLKPTEEAIP
jgi:hypothetical protein